MLLLGLGVTIACAIPLARGFLSLGWPEVDGVVSKSSEKSVARRSAVDIAYQYSVDGRTYTADRYRFRYPLAVVRSRDVHMSVGRYPVGERVKVSVNPADPADAVLEAGPDFETLIPFGLGLLLVLFGIGEARKPEPAYGIPPGIPEQRRPRYRVAKVLGVIGAAIFLFGAWYVYQGLASASWPAADGKILYSRARTGRSAETLLWYEYHVDGRRYLASNYRNGGNGTPFDDVAKEAAKRYPVGRTVTVYYDPGDPSNALLEPGLWWGNFIAPAIGMLVLFIAWVAKRFAEATAAARR